MHAKRADLHRLPSACALRRAAAVAVSLLILSGCATKEPLPPPAPPVGSVPGAAADEQRLIGEGNEFEADLREKGLVVEDVALQRYVDAVGTRLVPRLVPRDQQAPVPVRFLILREPTINAMSLPNGAVFVHQGLLVRLENEAQLAHVLAHEIAHVILRHHVKYTRSARKKIVAAKITQMSTVGIGSGLIEMTYAAAIMGYGRETEQEADLEGLRLDAAAGYDVEVVPGLFARLNEVNEPGAVESFFYSDHPSNNDRTAYTRRLIQSGTVAHPAGGRLNAEEYRRATGGLVAENIELRISNGHYLFALQEAKDALARHPKDPRFHYLAGEAHRSMSEDPKGAAREEAIRRRVRLDSTLIARHKAAAPAALADASASYQKALEADPKYVRAHRGLGLVAWRLGRLNDARRELGIYLAQGGDVPDRRYIRRLLAEMGT